MHKTPYRSQQQILQRSQAIVTFVNGMAFKYYPWYMIIKYIINFENSYHYSTKVLKQLAMQVQYGDVFDSQFYHRHTVQKIINQITTYLQTYPPQQIAQVWQYVYTDFYNLGYFYDASTGAITPWQQYVYKQQMIQQQQFQQHQQNQRSHYNNNGHHGYHHRNHQQNGHVQGSHPQQEKIKRNYNKNNQNQKYHSKGGYNKYHKQSQNTAPVQNKQIQVKPVEVTPPPPPPPPVPKPTKFSLLQIRQFIQKYSKEEVQKHANSELVQKVKQISSWKSQIIDVKVPQQKNKKNYNNRDQKYNDRRDQNKSGNFGMGYKKQSEAEKAKNLGYGDKTENKPVSIVIGVNETLQARKMKQQIKKMVGKDFATLKQQQFKDLGIEKKARIQIVYNLNLIVPENLKDIQKDLYKYLIEQKVVCQILIKQIIKKSWDQPKYSSTYAKLCSDFSKVENKEFKFKQENMKKSDNPFKRILIHEVQESFVQKVQKFPEFLSPEDKQAHLKDVKKRIISHVKFIAQLVLCKLIKVKLIKQCLSHLIQQFLTFFYEYNQDNSKQQLSIYDYQFQAIIQFLQNLGQKYQSIDQKQKQNKQQYDYNTIKNHILAILLKNQKPIQETLQKSAYLSADQYFYLFEQIYKQFLKAKFPRLGALYLNLKQRRSHKWEKHLSAAEGPKKLKQLEKDQDQQNINKNNKQKRQQQKLDKKVKQLFQAYIGKNQQPKQLKQIYKNFNTKNFYLSFLKQVADDKKDNIAKRVELFNIIMDDNRFKFQDFKDSWNTNIRYLAFYSADFPFCSAALGKLLSSLTAKYQQTEKFYIEFKQEEEDQYFFMLEVFQKYYYYSQDQVARNFIKPKPRLSGLL